MDVFSPFLHLALRSMVVLFPLTVGWLAFRRLALSKSANAWIYAAMCLFAVVSAAGVLPWTLGLTSLNWLLLLPALICPMLWIGVLMLCDVSRSHRYGPDPLFTGARKIAERTMPRAVPLILKDPEFADGPRPVFRHRVERVDEPQKPSLSSGTQTLLNLARDIRGKASSERRRPKLLPSPTSFELPFLPRSGDG